MNAEGNTFLGFLDGTKQCIIPIYQRRYSWTEKQCDKLWDDIVRIGSNDGIHNHFIGSIVYIQSEKALVTNPKLFVIDGQQRLATLSLLLAAFANAIKDHPHDDFTKEMIYDNYLFNRHRSGTEKYKLILTQNDKDTLNNILEGIPLSDGHSKNIRDNFEYFQKKILENDVDLNILYRGIEKLAIVIISLNTSQDNPQLIFESLNSTGVELSQADLIRNSIMMHLEPDAQNKIYNLYWHPMEMMFEDSENPKYFDRFMRDYLTIKTKQIPNIDNVYSRFKEYVLASNISVDDLAHDILYFAGFFTRLAFDKEKNTSLKKIIHDINRLKVDVAYPFLMEVLKNFDENIITENDAIEIFSLVESYVFRRSICEISTSSLNKIFANLIKDINHDAYAESLKAAFVLKSQSQRFPNDLEFKERFCTKNVYNFQNKKYLFNKLENYGKAEYCATEGYTLEHIMPQNENLSKIWQDDLGHDWREIQNKYLHTIGNLTLTGYNSKLSDKSFLEKKTMEGGFDSSPIGLNGSLRNVKTWNEVAILKRACTLAERAADIWKFPEIEADILGKYHAEHLLNDDAENVPWEEKIGLATDTVKTLVDDLCSQTQKKFECEVISNSGHLGFYVQKPVKSANCFAAIDCNRDVAHVYFRIDPDTFRDDDKAVKGTNEIFAAKKERWIKLDHENIPSILDYLNYSHETTMLLKKKLQLAAEEAVKTRERNAQSHASPSF